MMTREQAQMRLAKLEERMKVSFEALGVREKETLTDAAERLYAEMEAARKLVEGNTAR